MSVGRIRYSTSVIRPRTGDDKDSWPVCGLSASSSTTCILAANQQESSS
jgi:hypothetical protein